MRHRRSHRVVVTPDALNRDGTSVHGDLRLERLSDHGIEHILLPSVSPEITCEELGDADAALVMAHTRFTAQVIDNAPRLRHIARFGAGYDTIDIEACTRNGVIVTNTPDAVRRPVALAAMTLILALAHRLLEKDHLVREDKWDLAGKYTGSGITSATIGIVGFGNIGAELAVLLQPFDVRLLGANARGHHPRAAGLGVEIVDVDTLLGQSDFVVLCAALNPTTERMIGVRELALMQPSSYLINVGRGRLVDAEALRHALIDGTIAGAGLDVYDPEPPELDDPVLGLTNVILSPHALSWTREFTRLASASVVEALSAVANGARPRHVINPAVFSAER